MERGTHLRPGLQDHILQFGTSEVHSFHEVTEKGTVFDVQLREIIVVDVGGEKGMGHALAELFDLFDNSLSWLKKVDGNETNSGVGVDMLDWASGRDDDFRPSAVVVSELRLL